MSSSSPIPENAIPAAAAVLGLVLITLFFATRPRKAILIDEPPRPTAGVVSVERRREPVDRSGEEIRDARRGIFQHTSETAIQRMEALSQQMWRTNSAANETRSFANEWTWTSATQRQSCRTKLKGFRKELEAFDQRVRDLQDPEMALGPVRDVVRCATDLADVWRTLMQECEALLDYLETPQGQADLRALSDRRYTGHNTDAANVGRGGYAARAAVVQDASQRSQEAVQALQTRLAEANNAVRAYQPNR